MLLIQPDVLTVPAASKSEYSSVAQFSSNLNLAYLWGGLPQGRFAALSENKVDRTKAEGYFVSSKTSLGVCFVKITVAIPAYVCRQCGTFDDDERYYDHPTSLEAKGTLGRALASMKCLNTDGLDVTTVVIGCPTTRAIAKECDEKLQGIIKKEAVLPTWYMGYDSVERVRQLVVDEVSAEAGELYSLDGYASVRNACLLSGLLTDADATVLIDDDEIFEGKDFLQRVKTGLSGSAGFGEEKAPVRMLAGYYYHRDGTYLLAPELEHWTVRWRKSRRMNRLWKGLIEGEETLRKTPFALGGNFSISRDVARSVPFDPRATRGEDGDYIMNCMLLGETCWFDGKLGILHDPPPKPHRRHVTLSQDFQRFLYGRAKLQASKDTIGVRALSADDFEPYPGPFLGEDLPSRIVQTATLLALDHLAGDNDELYQMTMESMQKAFANVEAIEHPLVDYLKRVQQWKDGAEVLHKRVYGDWALQGEASDTPLQKGF